MPVPHHSVFTGQMPFLPPNSVKALMATLCSTDGVFIVNGAKFYVAFLGLVKGIAHWISYF